MDSNKLGKYAQDYKDLEVFFSGERAVKAGNEEYTPSLEGQKDRKQYDKYKDFGILFPALSRTRQGLKGAILRKAVDVDFQEDKKEVLTNIMESGGSFDDLAREATDEVLGKGRYGVLVDIDQDENPYAASYHASSILEWSASSRFGRQVIKLLEEVTVEDEENPGEEKQIDQMRQLELENGVYKVTIFRRKDNEDEGSEWEMVIPGEGDSFENPCYPSYKQKKFDFIPFSFFGSSNNTPEPSKPPLLDLLSLSKGHWKLSVAYYYGLHFAGLPTPCFAGFGFEDGEKIPLGPATALKATDSTAKAWYLQTGGAGLKEIVIGLEKIEKIMAVTGARMLEVQRPGVEAAETVKLRSSGDSATLADIAGNIENGLTDVLRNIGFFLYGVSNEDYKVTVNKDFVSTRLSSQDITALLEAYQGGTVSLDTFLWNLRKGEILEAGKTIEKEKEDIEEDRGKNIEHAKSLSSFE